MTRKRRLSVFDLDHTLLNVNGSYCFGSFLFKKGLISLSDVCYCSFFYTLHKFFLNSSLSLHKKIFNKMFLGKDASIFDKEVASFLDKNFEKMLYRPAVLALNEAKANSNYVVILSNSPNLIVRQIAERFGVDDWQATNYESDSDGKLTGVSNIMDGLKKASYVRDLMEKLKIDKEDIDVYTDSYLDLSILRMAGNPVLVNPDMILSYIGKKEKWQVI